MSGFTGATDKYIMIPLWNWSLQFVPIWMASVARVPRARASARALEPRPLVRVTRVLTLVDAALLT